MENIQHSIRSAEAGNETFSRVHEQHEDAWAFAERAKDICRAHVLAAHGADVHAARFGNEKTRRDRAKEITGNCRDNVTRDVHERMLVGRTWRMKDEKYFRKRRETPTRPAQHKTQMTRIARNNTHDKLGCNPVNPRSSIVSKSSKARVTYYRLQSGNPDSHQFDHHAAITSQSLFCIIKNLDYTSHFSGQAPCW